MPIAPSIPTPQTAFLRLSRSGCRILTDNLLTKVYHLYHTSVTDVARQSSIHSFDARRAFYFALTRVASDTEVDKVFCILVKNESYNPLRATHLQGEGEHECQTLLRAASFAAPIDRSVSAYRHPARISFQRVTSFPVRIAQQSVPGGCRGMGKVGGAKTGPVSEIRSGQEQPVSSADSITDGTRRTSQNGSRALFCLGGLNIPTSKQMDFDRI